MLINAENGHKESVFERMEKVEGVKDVYICSGIYDIIVVIEYKTKKDFKKKSFKSKR
jgi:hypothetical protein